MAEQLRARGTATGHPEADALLRTDANAVLIGILLDQQIRAEVAFSGPHRLKERLGHLDMRAIAAMDEEAFRTVFAEKPAVHSFTGMMAARVQTLARTLADAYDGDAGRLWDDGAALEEVERRVSRLPGFGPNKVKMIGEVLELFGHRIF